MNHKKFLKIASENAGDIAAIGSSRHFCLIVYRNRIISTGSNSKKTSPFQAKYGRNKESIYFHAETDAIKRGINLFGTDVIEKSTLYVARVDSIGNWALSRPCSGCLSCIDAFGIKKVIYTVRNKEYTVIER